MSWLRRLFGGKHEPGVTSEAEQKRIRTFYDNAFKKARDAAVNRTLSDVRVRPGQDPYAAGFSAMFAEEGNTEDSARQDAKKKTMVKYRLSEHAFDSIIKK